MQDRLCGSHFVSDNFWQNSGMGDGAVERKEARSRADAMLTVTVGCVLSLAVPEPQRYVN